MSTSSIQLLICAGGTGGGVYPALAVQQALLEIGRETELLNMQGRATSPPVIPPALAASMLWVGGVGGMEGDLVRRQGIPYREIPAAGVHGVGIRQLPKNLWSIGYGYISSQNILREFNVDVLFFTGGYTAVPMALAGKTRRTFKKKPYSILYVPDIEPGYALKFLARFADQVAVSAEKTRQYLPQNIKVTVTGYPTRPDLVNWSKKSKDEARRVLELSSALPIILVFGGSKGARSINQALGNVITQLLTEFQVIHISGELDWKHVEAEKKHLDSNLTVDLASRYHAFPYLHEEMGAAFASADLVICRAGASTLGELPLFGLPAILVPYPHAWRYQQVNAEYLAGKKAAVILQDAHLEERLLPTVRQLLGNTQQLIEMQLAMRSQAQPQAAQSIAKLILSMMQKNGGAA